MNARVWFVPATVELVGLAGDGTLITADADLGIGPAVEVTDAVRGFIPGLVEDHSA